MKAADVAQATVSIEVLAPQSKPGRLDDLLGSVEFSLDENSRSLDIRSVAMIYMCSYSSSNINGHITRKVAGACFGQSVTVVLPRNSEIAVWHGAKPVNAVANAGITPAGLIEMIKAESFDRQKMEVLNKILSSHRQLGLSPAEASAIVMAFDFDPSQKDAAIKVGARVAKSKRLEFYALIEDELGHFDKQDVLKALSQMP